VSTAEIVALPGDLIEPINMEYEAAESEGRSAVAHAVECGRKLLEAKAGLNHGHWEPWLAEHFAGTSETAAGYMRLAKSYPGTSPDLPESINAGYKALMVRSVGRPTPPPSSPAGTMQAALDAAGTADPLPVGRSLAHPSGLSDSEVRRWEGVSGRLGKIAERRDEACRSGLESGSVGRALNEAAQEARQVAIDLERLAAKFMG
jgi:Protein of unknown function (DUF3102)